jgi:hypothetical protein
LSLTALGFSQSLHLFEGGVEITNTTVVIPIEAMSSYVNEIEIHNQTSSNIDFKVNRTILPPGTLDADAYLYYCTGTQCYSPSNSVTFTPGGAPATIAANSSLPSGPGTYGISAHYDSGAAASDVWVLYRVYNIGTSGDTAYVTLHYAFATGIEPVQQSISSMTNAYPNPASSTVGIKYEIGNQGQNAHISVYDMLGKKVKEINLEEKQGLVKMDVSGLKAGVYFYSLIIDEKAISTKKLVVSSK